eukprot:jgi/Bigna1/68488/fgenesh1_pg.6_\
MANISVMKALIFFFEIKMRGVDGAGKVRSGHHKDIGAVEAYLRITNKEKTPKPRFARTCTLFDSEGTMIDANVLSLFFCGPKSYTGEDVIELHVHGNPLVVRGVMQALSRMEGLRTAQPGEFTRRAFENAKMDLMQIEGLSDLLTSETEAQRSQSLLQLKGRFGLRYDEWRERVLRGLAYLEATIDFAEDEADVAEEEIIAKIRPELMEVEDQIGKALSDTRRGEMIRHGVKLGIFGAPNVGKSSLLNALLDDKRAIVSDIPGTTRDVVQVNMNLGGYPVNVSDTAGIRTDVTDPIEREGISRSLELAKEANLSVFVVDASSTITNILTKCANKEGGEKDDKDGDTDRERKAPKDSYSQNDEASLVAHTLLDSTWKRGYDVLVVNKIDKLSDSHRHSLQSAMFENKAAKGTIPVQNEEGSEKGGSHLISPATPPMIHLVSCTQQTGIEELVNGLHQKVEEILAISPEGANPESNL